MSTISTREAARQFLEWAKQTLSPSSVAGYTRCLRLMVARLGELPLEQLTPADVSAWSRNWHLQQAAKRLASWATNEKRLLQSDPLDGMKLPKRGRRHRTATRAELVGLRRAAPVKLRHLLLALEETLARPHEMRRAKWENVRTVGGQPATREQLAEGRSFFLMPKFKGQELRADDGAVRIIPITARLGRLMVRLLRGPFHPGRFVFVNGRGREWTHNAVRLAIQRARRAAGTPADAFGENVVAYTLRHSGATAAVRAGVRDFRLAELMGHSTTRTTQRYVHLCPEDALADAARIAAARRA